MWADGRFVSMTAGSVENVANAMEADEIFLRELAKLNKHDRRVSPNPSKTYAPIIIARQPGSKGIGKTALERSMERLLDVGKIRVERCGPPSKQRQQLVVSMETQPPVGSQ
jgi:hypothetical protein